MSELVRTILTSVCPVCRHPVSALADTALGDTPLRAAMVNHHQWAHREVAIGSLAWPVSELEVRRVAA